MNSILKTAVLILLLLIVSCHEVKEEDYAVPVENIDFFSLKKKKLSELLQPDDIDYILLKNDDDNLLLGRIDKAMIHLGRIYLMDKRLKSLVVYDLAGKSLGRVGVFGQGPNEYLNISDFDVDNCGNIYILDGRLNKILIYNTAFNCVREEKLPFDADVLSVLHEDTLMFGLSSWNKREAKGYKIATINGKLEMTGQYFKYSKSVDPSFWISNYLFGKSKNYISYNQTINNDVPLFSLQGELKRIFRFDFGKENVQEEDKTEVERKIANFDRYTMLRKILAVTDRYIIGFIWEHRQTKMFVIDYISKLCYIGETCSDIDRRLGCGFCDGGIISYEDSESNIYPDSVNQHIKKENFILQIQHIK